MAANTGFFRGKSVIVSGGSRGIGLAIALKLARDGAKVAIFAKTVKAHPQLPGTIYTAVEEIEAVGGQGLACAVDIRDEQAVQEAVRKTHETFGHIDILINSASAVSPTPTLKTDMKRYDLMNSINTRGTFLVTKTCIPHLRRGRNPHVLNLSPPMDMDKRWFAPHLAYTWSKYGMSACRRCRKPEIMADAAYLLLQKPSTDYTGNFALDDELLAEAGVTDLDAYAYDPKADLIPDGFIPGGRALNAKI
ncbi:NAD(P)-dependent oxidoreductase [Aphelenchoides fujianensis]|nr:NAD(P)-dependent oxidoreductase [Aphelenchoides fujianensis]